MPRKKRDYKKEYREYHGTPEQRANRAARNRARRLMEKKHGKAAIAGKDIDHIKPLINGGTNAPSNLRIMERSKNRGRKPTKKGGK